MIEFNPERRLFLKETASTLVQASLLGSGLSLILPRRAEAAYRIEAVSFEPARGRYKSLPFPGKSGGD